MSIDLTLNEIEVILLMWIPREKQDLGKNADSARAKLLAARKEALGLFAEVENEM
jgi:hypothetical protein